MIEEVDPNCNVLARYAQGSGIDEPLAMLRSGLAYYQQDGLGSVTSLSDAGGALAQTYTFDSFGKLTASSGSLTNPFRYTGREYDSEADLYDYRARYYDINTGRFISEDPARFYGGFNFYEYVKNEPVDFTDPMGLQCDQLSPWTEIPSVWGGNGPSPYLTIEDGVFWVPAGWSFYGINKTRCICKWLASHTRIRKFYRVPVTEQAEFKCDCPPRTEYRTRQRDKEYEVDTPGTEVWPTLEDQTLGVTVQLGANAGVHPGVWKNSVTCLCRIPTP